MTVNAKHLQVAFSHCAVKRHTSQPFNKFAAIATAIGLRQIYYIMTAKAKRL